MHVEQCSYCRKWVAHKPILGTLHFCLTEEQCRAVDHARQMIEWQKNFAAKQERLGNPYERVLFDNLWDLYAR